MGHHMGSPPHSWRIQNGKAVYSDEDRITSTLVENTRTASGGINGIVDHLHTRGEYAFFLASAASFLGSPPHSWRILGAAIGAKIGSRITSTLVENTAT